MGKRHYGFSLEAYIWRKSLNIPHPSACICCGNVLPSDMYILHDGCKIRHSRHRAKIRYSRCHTYGKQHENEED